MMVELAELWIQLLGDKPLKSSPSLLVYNEKVKFLSALPVEITRGDHGASLSRDDLDELLTPARKKLEAKHFVSLVSFLANGLNKGKNTLAWDVAIPAIPVNVLRDSARFTPLNFKGLQHLRRIESAFLKSFTEIQDVTPTQKLGRLLLSAILYGGQLQNQWLEPWLQALYGRVRWNGGELWLDMERVWQYPRESSDDSGNNKRSAEERIVMNRRWFADPFTRAQIVNWLQLSESERSVSKCLPNAFDLVRGFLKHIGLSREDMPANITNLLDMAETRLGLTVSPFLASYASGVIRSVSLPAETWTRLYTCKLVHREAKKSEDDNPELQTIRHGMAAPLLSRPTRLSEQQKMLQKMRRIFSKGSGVRKGNAAIRHELSAFIDMHNLTISPLLRLLAQWYDFLLSPKGKNCPASVNRYHGAIATKLLVVCGNDDLLEFEAMEFTECYDQMVELVPKKAEKGVARLTLGRFHDYLVRRYEAPRLDQAIFSRRSGPAETTVDANLVSQVDFDRLKGALGWDDAERPPNATASLLIAILGFRCGMRRNEVRFLRTRDVQGSHLPEIVLRTTSMRRLKSKSSTRRLPIHILLTCDELALFMKWIERCKERHQDSLVFSINGMPFEPLPDSQTFVPIRQALTLVTGDETLRYHHLRHSFANWLLVRLTGIESLKYAAPFFCHSEFSEERITDLRSELLGNEHLGRKGAYVVASLCGHADLETTFTSYIHICDWLISRELSLPAAVPHFEAEIVMSASGMSRATIYRSLDSTKIIGKPLCLFWNWEQIFRNSCKTIEMYIDPLVATTQPPRTEVIVFNEEKSDLFFWERVQKALTMYQVDGADLKTICMKLEITLEEATSWVENATRLAEMKTLKTGAVIAPKPLKVLKKLKAQKKQKARIARMAHKAGLSPFSYKHHDLRKPNPVTGRIPFPTMPVAIQDRNQARRFLNTFSGLQSALKQQVITQVEYFRKYYMRSRNMLVFHEPAQACRFIEAVMNIGVKSEMIRLLDFPTRSESSDERNERRLYWDQQFTPHKFRWWTVNKNTYGGKRGYGTIGVQITGRLVNNCAAGGYSKNGFLFAFYLIDVARSSLLRECDLIEASL